MKNPPIHRHLAIIPFSHDHNLGLTLTIRLRNAANGKENAADAWATFCNAWNAELEQHFADEEELLLPLTRDAGQRTRLIDEHKQIAALANSPLEHDQRHPPLEVLQQLGDALHDHIRWEERVLFREIENSATDLELDNLAERTAKMEAGRPPSRARPKPKSEET